jgi:ribonuclease P protein component
MTAGTSSRLGRQARLTERRDFLRIKESGARLANGCLVANWRAGQPGAKSRLGLVTSRKVGPAVARNRARRLIREAFRLHQHEVRGPVDLVLIARPSIAGKNFSGVERDLLTTLRKAGLLRLSEPMHG